jgi:hypothetical protein
VTYRLTPILRHDAAIAAAWTRRIVRRFQDLLAVLLMAVLCTAFARQALDLFGTPARPLVASASASTLALLADIALRTRIRHFRTESPLAPAALPEGGAQAYRLVLHGALSLLSACLLCLPDLRSATAAFGSWWLTLIPIQIVAWMIFPGSRQDRLVPVRGIVTAFRSRHRAAGGRVAAAGVAVLISIVGYLLPTSASYPLVAAAVLALVGWFMPVDHATVNFERFAGHTPSSSLKERLRTGGGMALACLAGAAATLDVNMIAITGCAAGLLLLYKVVAVLLSRIVEARQVQFAFVPIVLVAAGSAVALPLATPVLLGLSVAFLWKRAERTTWLTA